MRRRLTTAPITRTQHRRGAVLVLFAILLFVLIPLASLILQSGWLTMTRRQMQSGTDAAALEALRKRDDPTSTNMQRRRDASNVVRSLYDDDLDPNELDPTDDVMRFSAGPVVNFGTGQSINNGTFTAGRNIQSAGEYNPVLELNLGDDPTGDLVAGTYGLVGSDSMDNRVVDGDVEPSSHAEVGDDPPLGNEPYDRDDFLPGDSNNSVLARLRRSNESDVPNVRSSGPRVPFLFGRGPFGGPDIAEEGETDFMSFAEQGSVVRATSIADAVPAWTVGRHTPDRSSAAEFFIDENVWRSAVAANATTLVVNVEANGRLVDTSSPPAPIGWLYTADDPNDNPDEGPPDALTIGVRLFEDARTALVDMSVSAYVPLAFDADPNPASTRHLICGFIRVTISGSAPGPWTLTPTGEARPIASENVSATFVSQDGIGLSADALSQFRIFANDDNLRATLLHAPALRRAY